MNITLYRFSKRVNSTKRPSGGTSYNVRLKGACSIESPVFVLEGNVDTLTNYTYAHAFNHYYFISDISIINDRIAEIYCSEDVLATYKTEIGSYTAFVERSASQFDKLLYDNMVESNGEYLAATTRLTGINKTSLTGCYVLRVADNLGSEINGISTYVCSASEIKSILGFLFNDESFSDALVDGAVKTFFNPFQYILSLYWYPFDYANMPKADTVSVYVGWWDTGVSCAKLGNPLMYCSTDVLNMPVPPEVYTDDFRAYSAAWSEWNLHIPGVGLVPLSGQSVINGELKVFFITDLVANSSTATLSVRIEGATAFTPLSKFSCSIGTSVQISQVESAGKGLLSTAFSAISGNLGGTVQNALGVFSPNVSTSGAIGSAADWRNEQSVELSARWATSKDVPLNQYGRPLKKLVQLSTLSGYIQCSGASVPVDALDGERTMINNYLNGGFYYE